MTDTQIKGVLALVAGGLTLIGGKARFHYSGQATGPAASGIGILLLAIGAFLLATG